MTDEAIAREDWDATNALMPFITGHPSTVASHFARHASPLRDRIAVLEGEIARHRKICPLHCGHPTPSTGTITLNGEKKDG